MHAWRRPYSVAVFITRCQTLQLPRCGSPFIDQPLALFVDSDGGADGTMASSSNDSHYSGSRVETPVSYMGDDDDEDDYDENDDED